MQAFATARHPAHPHPPLVWSREGEVIANPSPTGSYGIHRLGATRGSSSRAGSSPASQAKPSRTGNRPAGRDVSRRKRRQPKRINKFLTFRKIAVNDLVSRKMVHSAMVTSIASPIVTRTVTAVDPRTAIRGHVRQLHILYTILIPMLLFRQERPKKTPFLVTPKLG